MRRGSILGNEKVSSDSQVDALSCQSPESAKSIQFGPVDNGPGLHGSSFRSIGEPKKWLDRGESAKSMQFGPVEGEPGLQSALSARMNELLNGSSFRSIGEPKKWLDRGESAKSMQFGPVEGEPGLQSALSAREALGNSQKQASELESEVAALKVRS
jgi:hypothetical protein